MEKIIIAAVAENNVIGNEGDIPWDYPEDMKHFRETTMGYPVVMGRKTYESLPENYRPLEGRKNIVLSRSDPDIEAEVAESLEEAWRIAEETGKDRVFVIGGSGVYRQAMPVADKMILTEIYREFEGDTYFPDRDENEWEEEKREENEELSFVTYVRV